MSLWIIPLLSTNSYEGSYFQNICTSYCLAYSVNGLMYMRTYSLDAVTFSEFGLRKHNAKFDSPRWLVFLQLLLKIHTFHQYLEDLDLLEAIFKNFALAVFEAIKVKGRLILNLEAGTSKFCNNFWDFGCQPWKSKAGLCMANGSEILIYLTLISFFLHYLQE